ncbi:MAG: trigger factor [Gammaproteobacteria bacterium]|nr:MAG: trigger factor [Gammaproteobacteria bacterium]
MQVSVEKISSIECRLTIVVPADQVEQAYERQLRQFANRANIKGFRAGSPALISYIRKQHDKEVRHEAFGEVMEKSFAEAVKEKNLRPVSQPRVEPKTPLANQPFEFVASFEVIPEIEAVHCKIDNLEKLVVDVTADDVERVIEQLRKQHTKWTVVNRPAQEKDRVVVDYYAIFDGKSEIENKIQNFPLELGSKVMLPGFEEGLIGATAGDEKTLNLSFPADFGVAERAGKPVDFVVQVKQVYEADMPALEEQFAQKLGVTSIEELKSQVKQSLEQERDRLVKEKFKEQVFRHLLEQNPIEVPKALVHQEADRIHDEVYQHQHDHHQHSESEMTMFNELAKKRVTLGLLMAEYAKTANIQLDVERVKQRIQEIASAYEQPQEVIKWLSSPENRRGLEGQVMEDQAMDKLMEGIPTTDKTMSYAELKGIRI